MPALASRAFLFIGSFLPKKAAPKSPWLPLFAFWLADQGNRAARSASTPVAIWLRGSRAYTPREWKPLYAARLSVRERSWRRRHGRCDVDQVRVARLNLRTLS